MSLASDLLADRVASFQFIPLPSHLKTLDDQMAWLKKKLYQKFTSKHRSLLDLIPPARKRAIFYREFLPWQLQIMVNPGANTTTPTLTDTTPTPINDDQEMTTQTTTTTATPTVSTHQSNKKRKTPPTSPSASPETSRKALLDYLAGLVGTTDAQQRLFKQAKSRFDRQMDKHQPDARWLVEVFLDILIQVLAKKGRTSDVLQLHRDVVRAYRESALQAEVEVLEQAERSVKRRRQERLDESAEHPAIQVRSVQQEPMAMDDSLEMLDQGQVDHEQRMSDAFAADTDQLTAAAAGGSQLYGCLEECGWSQPEDSAAPSDYFDSGSSSSSYAIGFLGLHEPRPTLEHYANRA